MQFGSWPLTKKNLYKAALGCARKARLQDHLMSLPRAAVIVPLLNVKGKACILFEKRASRMRQHAGEVSFPGGFLEPGETPWQAAQRESAEELRWAPEERHLIGSLGEWHNRKSNVMVSPFLVFDEHLKLQNVIPNPDEVESYFIVSVEQALRPDTKTYRDLHEGWPPVPFFKINETYTIWGFTGFILDALLRELVRICGLSGVQTRA